MAKDKENNTLTGMTPDGALEGDNAADPEKRPLLSGNQTFENALGTRNKWSLTSPEAKGPGKGREGGGRKQGELSLTARAAWNAQYNNDPRENSAGVAERGAIIIDPPSMDSLVGEAPEYVRTAV